MVTVLVKSGRVADVCGLGGLNFGLTVAVELRESATG